jgi:hypothetical protein
VLGPALLAGLVLGILDYGPERVIAALALAIGGVVLLGSSRSSTAALERGLSTRKPTAWRRSTRLISSRSVRN